MIYLQLHKPKPLDIRRLQLKAQKRGQRGSKSRAKRILRIIKKYGNVCEKCGESKITIHHETYVTRKSGPAKYSLKNEYKIWCPLCHGSYHFEEIITYHLAREINYLNKSDKVYFKYPAGNIDRRVYEEDMRQQFQFRIE